MTWVNGKSPPTVTSSYKEVMSYFQAEKKPAFKSWMQWWDNDKEIMLWRHTDQNRHQTVTSQRHLILVWPIRVAVDSPFYRCAIYDIADSFCNRKWGNRQKATSKVSQKAGNKSQSSKGTKNPEITAEKYEVMLEELQGQYTEGGDGPSLPVWIAFVVNNNSKFINSKFIN